ncbi:MAG: hypothetical protein IT310_02605 [Anaerolineales bacterium]|nr:hypothetical protein [Anaerolineales bacterium]
MMDNQINCPTCGELNSLDAEICKNCHTVLFSKSSSLTPGQAPNKKSTSELEPILPEWLRDARSQARENTQNDLPESHFAEPKPPAGAASVDFLAGLGSQADDDEEETPDWLASITGVSKKPKKIQTGPIDARRVEVGGKDDFAREDEAPDWLASIQSQPKTEKDELTDWFKDASGPAEDAPKWINQSTTDDAGAAPLADETPDWLRQMQAEQNQSQNPTLQVGQFEVSDANASDWLQSLEAETPAQAFEPASPAAETTSDETPDWLSRLQAEQTNQNPAVEPLSQAFTPSDDLPAWLQPAESAQPPAVEDTSPAWLEEKAPTDEPLSFFESGPSADEAGSSSTTSAESPDWLKNLQDQSTPAPSVPPLKKTTPLWLQETSAENAEEASVPAWLSTDEPIAFQPPATEEDPQFEVGDIPGWLKAAAPVVSIFSEPAAEVEPPVFAEDSEAPDWLSTFKSVESSQPIAPFAEEPAQASEPVTPAFTPDALEKDDQLFAEMPDWLSSASEPANTPEPQTEELPAVASELPSWVQAMRPDANPLQQAVANQPTDRTLESHGALAGLQGVLPAVPGYVPSSKPKAHSILLQATEGQKSQALLLEQILAAEAEPQPLASYAPLPASRPLRWFLAFAVLALAIGMSVLNLNVFALPNLPMDTPNEIKGALDVAQNVPEGAPILVALDYHPSRAAELEAAAAPMLDQMDLLRHPRLVFISTHEMGPVLAERLLALPALHDRYRGAGQFTNLGYLPGGELGARAFMQNPLLTTPLDVSLNPAPLQQNISATQFVALLVLTDNAETAQSWIEQAAALKFPAPIVVIASSQAAPILQPYYASGQVRGLVSGLYGAAVFEQNNANRPGIARQYWDAYSLGLLFAALCLLLGGFVNLTLGAKDRALSGGTR